MDQEIEYLHPSDAIESGLAGPSSGVRTAGRWPGLVCAVLPAA